MFATQRPEYLKRFSPLAGIRLVESYMGVKGTVSGVSFSPLAGIRLVESPINCPNSFVSLSFSPLAGIRLVERKKREEKSRKPFSVSVPLRGLG